MVLPGGSSSVSRSPSTGVPAAAMDIVTRGLDASVSRGCAGVLARRTATSFGELTWREGASVWRPCVSMQVSLKAGRTAWYRVSASMIAMW